MKQLPDPLPGQSASEYLLWTMRICLSDPEVRAQLDIPALPTSSDGSELRSDRHDNSMPTFPMG